MEKRSTWRRLAYAASNARRREFYAGVLSPRDDYHLRYFGHQFGSLSPVRAEEQFPELARIDEVTLLHAGKLTRSTSLDIAELWILAALAKARDIQAACEIGTYNGIATVNIAANAPSAVIATVDLPLDGSVTLGDIPDGDANDNDPAEIGQYIAESQYQSQINQILEDSKTLDWGILPGPFDLILIDGCHHEEYVRIDTANALQHLKAQGVVIWHDYGQSPGVTNVVDQVANRRDMAVAALYGTRLAAATRKNLYE